MNLRSAFCPECVLARRVAQQVVGPPASHATQLARILDRTRREQTLGVACRCCDSWPQHRYVASSRLDSQRLESVRTHKFIDCRPRLLGLEPAKEDSERDVLRAADAMQYGSSGASLRWHYPDQVQGYFSPVCHTLAFRTPSICFSYFVRFQTSWAGFYTDNPARDITNFD